MDCIEIKSKPNFITVTDNSNIFKVTNKIAEDIIINATNVLIQNVVSAVEIQVNCSINEQVGDVVYLFDEYEVRKADNSNIATSKVIGIISYKINSTTCRVRTSGLFPDLLLESGSYYFLGTSGNLTKTATTASGSVLVGVGQALDDSNLLININSNYIIRS